MRGSGTPPCSPSPTSSVPSSTAPLPHLQKVWPPQTAGVPEGSPSAAPGHSVPPPPPEGLPITQWPTTGVPRLEPGAPGSPGLLSRLHQPAWSFTWGLSAQGLPSFKSRMPGHMVSLGGSRLHGALDVDPCSQMLQAPLQGKPWPLDTRQTPSHCLCYHVSPGRSPQDFSCSQCCLSWAQRGCLPARHVTASPAFLLPLHLVGQDPAPSLC